MPPLAVTMGDPAGVGPELTTRAWQHLVDQPNSPVFFAIDDPENIRLRARNDIKVQEIATPEEAVGVFAKALPVLPEALSGPVTIGQPNPHTAPATIRSIERAVRLTQEGRAGGVVTNPITKRVLYDGAGFSYPGHTEFLAALCGVSSPAVMMLAGQGLRVVPVTIHIPLKDVPEQLTHAKILHTIQVVDHALRTQFGIPAPNIVVAGLNPHAGEGGAMGREEHDVIAPAIHQAHQRGVNVVGCFPADTLFHAARRETYDCAICMYHDQALIPVKTLFFDTAVNVTLGLPIVRTSPDHGTAYDIAGTGQVNINSFLNALQMAHQCYVGI